MPVNHPPAPSDSKSVLEPPKKPLKKVVLPTIAWAAVKFGRKAMKFAIAPMTSRHHEPPNKQHLTRAFHADGFAAA
jgi:hypothetical protein